MQGINFIAIDFETATGKRASICEAGICVVRDGKIVETRSWLVRKEIATAIGACRYTASVRMIRLILRNSRKYGQKSANTLKTFPYLWLTMPLSTSVVSVTRWNYTAWRSWRSLIIVPSVRHANFIASAATVWTISATSSGYLTGNTTGQGMMRKCAHGCF